MTQAQERTTAQSAIIRSEQLVDRMGNTIGSFAALTRQRIQQTAIRINRGTGSSAQPKVTLGKQPNQNGGKASGGPAPLEGIPQAGIQKAERLVDDMGQRLSLLASTVGLQVRKMAAYARESTEDVWVEAQHMRSALRH